MTKEKLVVHSILILSLLFLSPNNALAHPGRTASDGCHYCRTNCASWGEVSGTRHCHGGYTAPAPVYTIPTSEPTAKPTLKPTPLSTPTPTQPPSPPPEVKGKSDKQPTPEPSPADEKDKEDSGNSTLLLLGASGIAYMFYKKRKKINDQKEKNNS